MQVSLEVITRFLTGEKTDKIISKAAEVLPEKDRRLFRQLTLEIILSEPPRTDSREWDDLIEKEQTYLENLERVSGDTATAKARVSALKNLRGLVFPSSEA